MSQPAKSTSPFVLKRLLCPSCNKEAVHRGFRRNMFLANKVENDQHVLEYRWLNPHVTQFHPPHYFVFFCPNCYYTDIAEDYHRPFETDFGAQVLKSFKRANDFQGIIVESFGTRIQYEENISFESAMYLHLLALHQQMMPPDDLQDSYKMARIALRIAWLFRENKGENGSADDEEPEEPEAKSPLLVAVLKARKDFEGALAKMMQQWPTLENAMERRGAEIVGGIRDRENPYAEACAAMPPALKALSEQMFALDAVINRDESGGLSSAKQEVTPETREEVAAFLKQIKDYWPVLPVTEREATNLAIQFFRRAIETDSRLGSHETYVSVSTLVTNLLIRKGDLRGAVEMVRGMYQSGVDSRTQLQEKLREEPAGSQAAGKMQQKLSRVTKSIEEAADFRDQIVSMMLQRDADKIKAVFSGAAGQTRDQVQEMLLKQGVAPEVIARLKKPGGPLAALK